MSSNFFEENQNLNNKIESQESTPQSIDLVKKKKKKLNQKKICMLCKRGVLHIDYKNVTLLRNYLKKNNKIVSHKINGNCLKHQHQIKNSIKRARILALLPFVVE